MRRQSLKKRTMSKKDQWKSDENAVRHETCDFQVKYLGYTEVHESKGTDICKHSFHRLKYDESGVSLAHIFNRNKRRNSTDSHHQYATFHINGDAVRIVDENDEILVETPIARISFCCPIGQHVKGFTFICRGEVPWKWNCHAMEAVEDLGERLNHAVGCAFSVCLEKRMLAKRQNDVDATTNPITIEYHHQDLQQEGGSQHQSTDFRKLSITDRQIDPQANIRPESRPRKFSDTTTYSSVDRPRAPDEMKSRKGSLGDLMEAHPYKQYLKENINEEEMELRSSTDA